MRKIVSYDYDSDPKKLSLAINRLLSDLETVLHLVEVKSDKHLVRTVISAMDQLHLIQAATFGVVQFNDGEVVSADVLTRGEIGDLSQYLEGEAI